jgi:predicted  nucleic acid-binding Zn-ribbon protein
MGMPALKLEFEEIAVEDRLGRLEVDVKHIQSDISEMKADIRRLDGKIDAVDKSLSAKIDAVDRSLSAKIDAVKDSLAAQAVSTEKGFSKMILWVIGLVGVLLTVLARGFHWL